MTVDPIDGAREHIGRQYDVITFTMVMTSQFFFEINGLKLTNSEYERTETEKGDTLRW